MKSTIADFKNNVAEHEYQSKKAITEKKEREKKNIYKQMAERDLMEGKSRIDDLSSSGGSQEDVEIFRKKYAEKPQ